MNSHNKKNTLIYIIEDQALINQLLSKQLLSIRGFKVVGSAEGFSMDEIVSKNPDVVIMDIRLINENGIDATSIIKQRLPNVKVLMLSGFCSKALIGASIKAGASGYLTKYITRKTLEDAIRAIMDSSSFYLQKELREEFNETMEELILNHKEYSLTQRERSILTLIVQEVPVKEIAKKLGISEKTVRNHKSRIMAKLTLKPTWGLQSTHTPWL